MTSPTDAAANQRVNDLLRQRPNRATALPSPAGKPAPVTNDAAAIKFAHTMLNEAIRQGATRTPWPVPADDDGEEG